MGAQLKERNLDGIYLRVQVNGRWENRCLTDIPWEEIERTWANRSAEWWRSAAQHLHGRLRFIGDELDLHALSTPEDAPGSPASHPGDWDLKGDLDG